MFSRVIHSMVLFTSLAIGAAEAQTVPPDSMLPSLKGVEMKVLTVQDWGYGKREALVEFADGVRVEFNVDYRGTISEAKAVGYNAPIPAPVVDRVLPEAVSRRPEMKTLGSVRKIEFSGGRVEIDAFSAERGEMKAEFGIDGGLFKLKRD